MMQLAQRTASAAAVSRASPPPSIARAAAASFANTAACACGRHHGAVLSVAAGARRHLHSGSDRLAPSAHASASASTSKPKVAAAKKYLRAPNATPSKYSAPSSSSSRPPSFSPPPPSPPPPPPPPSSDHGSDSSSNGDKGSGAKKSTSLFFRFVVLTLGASGVILVAQIIRASFFPSSFSSSDDSEGESSERDADGVKRISGSGSGSGGSGGDGLEPAVPHWSWDAYERGGAGVMDIGRIRLQTGADDSEPTATLTAEERATILTQLRRALPLNKRETVVAALATSEEEALAKAAAASSSSAPPAAIAGRNLSVVDLASIQQSHPLSNPPPRGVAPSSSSSHPTATPSPSPSSSLVVRDFAILSTRAAHSYAQACYLLDNPVGWELGRSGAGGAGQGDPTSSRSASSASVSARQDPAQLLARELLQTATQQLVQSIAYYQTHAQELCRAGVNTASSSSGGAGAGAGAGPAISRVWAQWAALTDVQARLGLLEGTEGSCAAFTTAVVQHAALPGADKLAAAVSRAACSRLVFERLARVYAQGEGDWARSALQMQRVLQASNEYASLATQPGAMARREVGALASLNAGGNECEIVEMLAALSHAALATAPKASSKASANANANATALALQRAQHAVALVGVHAEKLFVTSTRDLAVMEQAANNACQLAQTNTAAPLAAIPAAATNTQEQQQQQPPSSPPPVGQVPYEQLLSPAVLARVLDRELLYAHAVLLSTSKATGTSSLVSSVSSFVSGGNTTGSSSGSGGADNSQQQSAASLSASKNAAIAARNHAYLLRRRRAAAIAYQQLGNALQAAGDTDQAHKAWQAAETMGRIQL